MVDRTFTRIHAQHVRSLDGVDIEFTDRNSLRYSWLDKTVIIPVETFIAEDGAPDGVVVHFEDVHYWQDNFPFSPDDANLVMRNLIDAQIALRTRFHLKRSPKA